MTGLPTTRPIDRTEAVLALIVAVAILLAMAVTIVGADWFYAGFVVGAIFGIAWTLWLIRGGVDRG